MSQLQMTTMVFGFYLLVGFVVVFLAMEYDKGARKTFEKLIQISRVAWFIGAGVSAILWPIILVDEARRAFREWKHPASKWAPGTPEFDAAVAKAVRKNLSSNKYLKEKIGKFIEENPKCLRCGVAGRLRQYDLSLWVICDACKGRVFTPNPSTPESADQVPVLRDLPLCGICRAPVLDWEEQDIKWKSIVVGGKCLSTTVPESLKCPACRKDTI